MVIELGELPQLHRLQIQMQPQITVITLTAVPADEPVVEKGSESEAPCPANDMLSEAALALRTAQRAAYDDLLDVSALLSPRPSTMNLPPANEARGGVVSEVGSPTRAASTVEPVHVGDELLTIPRLHALLSRRDTICLS